MGGLDRRKDRPARRHRRGDRSGHGEADLARAVLAHDRRRQRTTSRRSPSALAAFGKKVRAAIDKTGKAGDADTATSSPRSRGTWTSTSGSSRPTTSSGRSPSPLPSRRGEGFSFRPWRASEKRGGGRARDESDDGEGRQAHPVRRRGRGEEAPSADPAKSTPGRVEPRGLQRREQRRYRGGRQEAAGRDVTAAAATTRRA